MISQISSSLFTVRTFASSSITNIKKIASSIFSLFRIPALPQTNLVNRVILGLGGTALLVIAFISAVGYFFPSVRPGPEAAPADPDIIDEDELRPEAAPADPDIIDEDELRPEAPAADPDIIDEDELHPEAPAADPDIIDEDELPPEASDASAKSDSWVSLNPTETPRDEV